MITIIDVRILIIRQAVVYKRHRSGGDYVVTCFEEPSERILKSFSRRIYDDMKA